VALEIVETGFLQGGHTVVPVVLEMSQGYVHRVGGADPGQTAQGEVVV